MIDQSSIKNALARHSFMSHSRLIFIILLYLVAHQTIWLCIHKASAKLHSRSLTRSWGRRKRVNIKLNNFSTPSTKDKISSPTCICIYIYFNPIDFCCRKYSNLLTLLSTLCHSTSHATTAHQEIDINPCGKF